MGKDTTKRKSQQSKHEELKDNYTHLCLEVISKKDSLRGFEEHLKKLMLNGMIRLVVTHPKITSSSFVQWQEFDNAINEVHSGLSTKIQQDLGLAALPLETKKEAIRIVNSILNSTKKQIREIPLDKLRSMLHK